MSYYIDHAVEMSEKAYNEMLAEMENLDEELRKDVKHLIGKGIADGKIYDDGTRILQWPNVSYKEFRDSEAWDWFIEFIDEYPTDDEDIALIRLGEDYDDYDLWGCPKHMCVSRHIEVY